MKINILKLLDSKKKESIVSLIKEIKNVFILPEI